jgi:hypothetical protein
VKTGALWLDQDERPAQAIAAHHAASRLRRSCAAYAPNRHQHTFLAPIGPAEIDPGPAGSRRLIWQVMVSKGAPKYGDPKPRQIEPRPIRNRSNIFLTWPRRRGPKNTLRYAARRQQGLVPLALASLGLGSRRPLDGLFKSGLTEFQI